ncbi:MAG TPA: transcription-repair coupling factor [Vicinamibacterales bacterium]|nr:transcription-repair coupling factor [Vicinamibacterales bacterium]
MTTTTTSLTLQSLLLDIVARAGLARPQLRITGLGGSARALAAAAAAHRLRPRPVVFVVPADSAIDEAVDDVRFLLQGLEGLSDQAVGRAVLPLPSLQVDPYRGLQPHFRATSARAQALHALVAGRARIVVASAPALLPRLAPPDEVRRLSAIVRPGQEIAPDALIDMLAEGGYERQDPVDEHGEFCLRGGILDVFAAGDAVPVRLEFVGDTVESIRRFDPATQRSIETVDQFAVVPVRDFSVPASGPDLGPGVSIADYLLEAQLVVAEPEDARVQVEQTWASVRASFAERVPESAAGTTRAPEALMVGWDDLAAPLGRAVLLEELGLDTALPDTALAVAYQPPHEFKGRIPEWVAEIRQALGRGDTVLFAAGTRGRAERTVELLRDYDVRATWAGHTDEQHGSGAVIVVDGHLSRGFRLADAAVQVYAAADVFDEDRRRTQETSSRRSATAAFLSDLRDLKVGDLIVHVDHGIGQYVGLKRIAVGEDLKEFLELRYHGEDKLFVPVERLDLIQKYGGGARPPLDRLGGTTWERAKTRVKKAMRDMAEELLKLYAARRAVAGHAFHADTHWQEEFEGTFPYELTVDQASAIADIKRDMESAVPMDRLLCGDVGYGKTEVAMRAAFKAVMDGKQVAVLAPTTVLAFQHLTTLGERFAAFPTRIDMVSRFRSRQEIGATLADLAAGRVDVIVGTHRLLSKDVQFRDLGLLVVDEEQRFGVTHKERIKQMRKRVDVLTMTATPIPRTLNMSLVGIRDMSVIETPPRDRLAIQTNVVKFDADVITRAIRAEIARGGQVYFVHNRVESIFSMGNLLQRLVPEARVVTGHGQMGEDVLERAMLDFMAHRFDVLLATTIVENGLDIPNANTIIINRADRYGLSQLYQLRGRVGRSDRPAFAYLLIPPEQSLSPVARKRLAAIKEFSDLGSGFRVAALDLEIRGAGNLLGGEQSGHIEAVGFEMYTKLLEETIRELKGEDLEDDVRAVVNLKVDFRLDDSYVPDMNQRLTIYRRVAGARSEDDIAAIVDEVRDRYGAPPTALLNLADYARIRVLADRLGLESLDREGSAVVLKIREKKATVDPVRLINLVQERGDLRLFPPATLKMDLAADVAGAEAPALRTAVPALRTDPLAHRPGPAYRPGTERRGFSPGGTRIPRPARKPAWWAARATSGEVAPGFSKSEILKAPAEDARAPGGVIERVTGLLLVLLDEQ